MAFGFGKKWWKRVSGISAAQRKMSRKLGIRLSDGLPTSSPRSSSVKNQAGFPCAYVFAGVCALIALVGCGFCAFGGLFSNKPATPPLVQKAPPKTDKERIQGEWVDSAGEWVWEFAGDEVTIWRRGGDEAKVHQFVLWPAPANQIDIWGDPRRGIYCFDGDRRLTLALGENSLHRPKTFDPAEGVELIALRPLAEAEAEWEAQARKANELPLQPASDSPGNTSTPTAKAPGSSRSDPPHVAEDHAKQGLFVPVPPIRTSAGPKEVHVHEYTRKDGTVVHAHNRAAPGMGGGRKK